MPTHPFVAFALRATHDGTLLPPLDQIAAVMRAAPPDTDQWIFLQLGDAIVESMVLRLPSGGQQLIEIPAYYRGERAPPPP